MDDTKVFELAYFLEQYHDRYIRELWENDEYVDLQIDVSKMAQTIKQFFKDQQYAT